MLLFSSSAFAQQPSAWADKLFAGDVTHDFGNVAKGSQLKHSFKLTNIYKVPLDITDLRVSCGCVRAEMPVKTVPPGESVTLNVNMDARQFVGSKTVKIMVTVGPKFISTATLTVSANARGDVSFTPNEIDFGNIQHGQTTTKAIEIEYMGGMGDWRVNEIVKSGAAPFELKVEELPRLVNNAQRKGYRILATMKADAASGSFRQEIVLKTNDPTAPMLTFQVVGNVQAGLAVSPSAINVRDLKVGESQTKKVFVRSARPFRITSIDGQGDGIKVEAPTKKDTTQVLTVHIAPTKAGELRKQLMIHTDLDGEAMPLVIEATIEP
jgi:hypothetical protein